MDLYGSEAPHHSDRGFWASSATMGRYIAVEVLTGLLAGVPWSPWLFALQDVKVQERSGEDRSGVRC